MSMLAALGRFFGAERASEPPPTPEGLSAAFYPAYEYGAEYLRSDVAVLERAGFVVWTFSRGESPGGWEPFVNAQGYRGELADARVYDDGTMVVYAPRSRT